MILAVKNSGMSLHISVFGAWTQMITRLFTRVIMKHLMKTQNYLDALDLFHGHNNQDANSFKSNLTLFHLGKDNFYHRDSISRDKA
jgi:hypothetical protein